MSKTTDKEFPKQSIYSLQEALDRINLSSNISPNDLINYAVQGEIKLCASIKPEWGEVGRIDMRLMDLEDAVDSDGHITVKQDWLGVFDEYPDLEPNIIAVFLTKSDCKHLQYHKALTQVVFRSAYKIKADNFAEETKPIFPSSLPKTEFKSPIRYAFFDKNPERCYRATVYKDKNISFSCPNRIPLTIKDLSLTEYELLKFISMIKNQQNELPEAHFINPQPNTSRKLVLLSQAARKFWEGKGIDRPAEHPSNDVVIAHLFDQEVFGDNRVFLGKIAKMIRPKFARKIPEPSSWITDELKALWAASDRFWKNADLDDYSTYENSSNPNVKNWLLKEFKISLNWGEAGAAIIRPEAIRHGRPKIKR